MGILDLFRVTRAADNLGLLSDQHSQAIVSPWTGPNHLATVVWSDILGSEELPVTRAEAMSVPAIARGRHKICSRGARLPLVELTVDAPVEDQPAWLTKSGGSTAWSRMLWTLDDLVHSGWSLWLLDRPDGDFTPEAIQDGYRVPQEWWEFDPDSKGVLVNGVRVPDSQVLVIPGPHEGVLNFASRTVRGGRRLEELWVERVQNPVPVGELHQTDQVEMEDAEIDDMLDGWSDSVRQRGGTFGYTPHNIELIIHGDEAGAQLMIEGRNAAAIDSARVVGLPAAMVDASNVNSTLTYETLQGRNLEFAEDLGMYLDPIAARLSLDDTCRPGNRVAFDTSTLTGPWSTTGPATKD